MRTCVTLDSKRRPSHSLRGDCLRGRIRHFVDLTLQTLQDRWNPLLDKKENRAPTELADLDKSDNLSIGSVWAFTKNGRFQPFWPPRPRL